MPSKIKIVADENIPFLKGVFEPYADVVYLCGRDIRHSDIINADALIIRTRTRCDQSLLAGTRVSMIATATIGMDHIDVPYCISTGIEVHNAAGCNAGGVMQYVFSALYGAAAHNGIDLQGKTFGIIGVGNVGKRVEGMARHLGFNVLLCDPPRAAVEGGESFASLDYLLHNSDIVSIHTPLDETTRSMADEQFFIKMKNGAIFINSARGEIVVDKALSDARPKLGAIIIDTWNNEPFVDKNMIRIADIATPHIAGYSFQGKINGTMMAVRQVARRFGIYELYDFYPRELPENGPQKLDLKGKSQGEIAASFQYNYPVFTDDFMFRTNPELFEQLRQDYRYRREIYI